MSFFTQMQEPQRQSTLSSILQGLGGGIGEGISSRMQNMLAEKQNKQQGSALANAIGKPELSDTFSKLGPDFSKLVIQEFGAENVANAMARLQGLSTKDGESVSNQDITNQVESPLSEEEQFAKEYKETPAKYKKDLLSAQQKSQKMNQQKEMAYIKLNEPHAVETNERAQALEQTDAELERLNDLFNTGKLPSSFTAAMFDLGNDSGIDERYFNRIGRSRLSPEAQEAVKIITSQIKGISKIFPGRILQTEVQNFMKTLPGLLNSPEGRSAILRGMRIFNKMGQFYTNALQDELKTGLRSKPFSEMQAAALEKVRPQISDLRSLYLNPNKNEFETFPDASIYKGQHAIDDETGQEFESNGIEWIPVNTQK